MRTLTTVCKFCGISFDGFSKEQKGNHTHWCDKNPNHDIYKQRMSDLGKRKHDISKESRQRAAEKLSLAHQNGKFDEYHKKQIGVKRENHSEETKKLLSDLAKKREKPNKTKTRIPYFCKESNHLVILDSTWEESLAKRLDFLNIRWIRPGPLPYVINDTYKSYFADFYLIDYNIYLDPKSPFTLKVQEEKNRILLSTFSNLRFISSKSDCENFEIKDYL